MAASTLTFPRLRATAAPAISRRVRTHRFPVENTLIFAAAATFYIVLANYLVFHSGYMINDAYTRVDNAFDVLYSRDPHLAAIGFFWPPLPSFFDIPILAFKGIWPALATKAFAGSIEAALFSAGTTVLFNGGLRWARVARPLRWLFCIVWVANPMTAVYAVQGMSEAMFIFFFVASILVFLRWCESGRTALLPLAGVLVGADCLCRNEALVVAVVMGVAVVVQSVRNGGGGGWRRVETEALLFGLPALFMIMLWLASAAIIFRDPLYLLHANGFGAVTQPGGAAPDTGAARSTAYGLVALAPKDGIALWISHAAAICPAVFAFVAMLGARFLVRQGRVAAVSLLAFGLVIAALDVYLQRGGLALLLRYQIAVIPFTFLVGVFVLRSFHRRLLFSSLLAVVMIVILGLSNVVTLQTLSDPAIAFDESAAINALTTGAAIPDLGGKSPLAYGPQIVSELLALDKDHGLIECDSATCFALNMSAPDPKIFVVTSDENFEAAASQPQVYGVEYFLVPEPTGSGAIDRLNNLYPSLWRNGGGFGQYVGSGKGGGPFRNWRLYRIIGPTGRG